MGLGDDLIQAIQASQYKPTDNVYGTLAPILAAGTPAMINPSGSVLK